jgi:hypothetical protein
VTAKRQKGRAVPVLGTSLSRERIRAGVAIKAAHQIEIEAAALSLPREVRLADGRVLVCESPVAGGNGYRCRDGMVVVASYDPSPHGLLLHISVSYKARDPTWGDLKLLRQAFFPADVDVIQVLPRAGEYVNVHEHCFHLFQAPEAWQGGWNV